MKNLFDEQHWRMTVTTTILIVLAVQQLFIRDVWFTISVLGLSITNIIWATECSRQVKNHMKTIDKVIKMNGFIFILANRLKKVYKDDTFEYNETDTSFSINYSSLTDEEKEDQKRK